MTKRLRVLPEPAAPILIDPPDAAEPDQWRSGWNACRETAAVEIQAAYERGLAARPVQQAVCLDPIGWVFCFIVGVLGGAWLAQ